MFIMKAPRLKDSKKSLGNEPFPLNEPTDEIITKIGAYLVYLIYSGQKDLSGNAWGDAFAYAIDGTHLESPCGIADVIYKSMAWSLKTVKLTNIDAKTVRLISGRCSPDFSYGIQNPHEDVQKTGTAVLGIWNERVNIAQEFYSPVRTGILLRNYELTEFCYFEEENHRFRVSDYRWEVNKNGNLIGIEEASGRHCFTWQPHGSQFTMLVDVPVHAIRFKVKTPPKLNCERVLRDLQFDKSWVEIIKSK